MLKFNMISLLLITKNKEEAKKYLFKEIVKKNDLFFEIIPEKKEYSINNIKNLWSETKIFNKSKRIYFLANFHIASLEAQNAFLKLLEEPPKNVLFVITTDNQNKLLSTIVSRTKIINLNKKVSTENDLDKDKKKLLETFLKDKNLNLIKSYELSIDDIILFFKEKLIKENKKSYSIILKEALKIKNLLENNNLNSQLAFDHLFIYIKKILNFKK